MCHCRNSGKSSMKSLPLSQGTYEFWSLLEQCLTGDYILQEIS